MNHKPSLPVAVIRPFPEMGATLEGASRFGASLVTHALAGSLGTAGRTSVENDAPSTDSLGIASPRVPFAGIEDGGHTLGGGTETTEACRSARSASDTRL
jgi:hypothetical protein